jgi:hypothetical protein
MANEIAVPIPQGATTAPIQSSDAMPIPQGAITAPINASATSDSQTQQSTQQTQPPARSTLDQVMNADVDLAKGFGKGVLQTTAGIGELIHKIPVVGSALIPQAGLSAEEQAAKPEGIMQHLGNVGEVGLEWASGEELLSGLSRVAKLEQLAKNSPTIASALSKTPELVKKVFSSATKGAVVGGAQGGVKGAAEGDAEGGAIGGAAGGAIGSTVAEGIGPGLKTLGKVFGLGLDSEEALVRGVKPSVGEDANFRKALQTAEPRIVEAAKADPPKTVGDFEDLLHNKAQDIRQNEFGPMIQRNAKQMVSAQPVAANIRSAITDQMREYAPDEAKELEDFAVKFSKDMPLGKAESDLQYFNAQLKKFYKANAVDQSAALKTNGTVAKYEAAADGLRDLIYGRLKELGENAPEDLQRQYGALKTLERSVAKRATVSERQNPLNLTEIMGLLAGAGEAGTAIAAGHPLAAVAGVLPYAAAKTAKVLNSSDSLVKRGVQSMVKDAGPAGAFQKIAPTAGSVLKTGTAAGAAAIGANEWVKVQDSNGQQWEVHPSDLAQMQQKDPGVQLVQPN